jgi:soluble lytic murein transglycosylase-like protein
MRLAITGQKPAQQAGSAALADPAVAAIDSFLDKQEINSGQRARIASAIVASGRKYDLDPRLIASVVVVESHGNPFAISESDSVGMMQINLKTWGTTADKEDINLFKIEDNINFGSRILKEYSGRFGGIWEGVKRYKGWNPESQESAENVQAYIDKVRGIYTGDTLVSGN